MKLGNFLRENVSKLTDYGLSGLGSLIDDSPMESEILLHKAENFLSTTDSFFEIHQLLIKAIDIQIFSLLSKLGIIAPNSFEEKIAVVNKLGILAPRILMKIRELSNDRENGSDVEKKERLENQLDITVLFVKTTKRFMCNFFQDFEMVFHEETPDWGKVNRNSWLGSAKHGYKMLFHDKGKAHIQVIGVLDYSEIMNYRVESVDGEYIPLIRAFIKLSLWEIDPVRVFRELYEEVLMSDKLR